mmetsp:Transcript_43935/g.106530  ORF Transcript_43935/g.106530 Transcript_43935/m.106530 type:complete len:131 (+) Transcript_43935:33-425(+)
MVIKSSCRIHRSRDETYQGHALLIVISCCCDNGYSVNGDGDGDRGRLLVIDWKVDSLAAYPDVSTQLQEKAATDGCCISSRLSILPFFVHDKVIFSRINFSLSLVVVPFKTEKSPERRTYLQQIRHHGDS